MRHSQVLFFHCRIRFLLCLLCLLVPACSGLLLQLIHSIHELVVLFFFAYIKLFELCFQGIFLTTRTLWCLLLCFLVLLFRFAFLCLLLLFFCLSFLALLFTFPFICPIVVLVDFCGLLFDRCC